MYNCCFATEEYLHTFELEETAMSKKNKQKQQGGQTQPTDTAEK